jgi:hypothetical protein
MLRINGLKKLGTYFWQKKKTPLPDPNKKKKSGWKSMSMVIVFGSLLALGVSSNRTKHQLQFMLKSSKLSKKIIELNK